MWGGGPSAFQNPHRKDRWQSANAVGHIWGTLLRKAGVRYRNQYQTRHTFATTALNEREDIRWISEQMGHTDWTFTAKTYTKWMPNAAPDAGKKMGEKLATTFNGGQHMVNMPPQVIIR